MTSDIINSNWFSVYIFHNISFEKVLIEGIQPLIQNMVNSKFITSYFFIRYWDNGPHIRLRVLPSEVLSEERCEYLIIDKLSNYFKKSQHNNTYYSVESHLYNRDYDRYGGLKAMQISEKQFALSTKTVLQVLNNNIHNWEYSTAISIAMQMHLLFARVIFNNRTDILNFFQKIHKNWLGYSVKLDQHANVTNAEIEKTIILFSKSYNNQKQNLEFLIKEMLDGELAEGSWQRHWFEKSVAIQKDYVIAYNSNGIIDNSYFFNFLEKRILFSNDLDNRLYPIYDSLIHMTNNRLGINLRDESFIAFMLFKVLDATK